MMSIAAAIMALGCRGSTEPRNTADPEVRYLLAPGAAANQPVQIGGHTLVLQSVRVSGKTLELVSTVDPAGHDCHNDVDGTCMEYESPAFATDLLLAGGPAPAATRSVPPGSYNGVEVELTEIRAQGTYDGNAFDVSLTFDTEINLFLATPLVMGRGQGFELVVSTEVRNWFRSADGGSIIDPRTLPGSNTQRAAVRQNVLPSFSLSGRRAIQ